MKKLIIATIGLVIIGVGLFLAKDFLPSFTSSNGELRIDSAPKATVFINGENRDQSPFLEQIAPGEYDVKLIPENESATSSWQQTITVNPGLQTYINVNLASTDADSSWETITLEKAGRSETEISIFSSAEPAEIFFDGQRKGTTPLSFKDISAGTHDVRLVAVGYRENTIKVTMTPGYKLTLNAQLALDDEAQKELEKETEKEETKNAKTTVTIAETPYGWLRVRSDSTTSGEELGKVNTGDTFEVLDEANGWYKIEFEDGNEGWISGKYATKNEPDTNSPSDSSTDKKEPTKSE